jgi:hypothetical protein
MLSRAVQAARSAMPSWGCERKAVMVPPDSEITKLTCDASGALMGVVLGVTVADGVCEGEFEAVEVADGGAGVIDGDIETVGVDEICATEE